MGGGFKVMRRAPNVSDGDVGRAVECAKRLMEVAEELAAKHGEAAVLNASGSVHISLLARLVADEAKAAEHLLRLQEYYGECRCLFSGGGRA